MAIPLRGTLLNTATVFVGASLGLLLRQALPGHLQTTALVGIGLVNIALGVKMFLGSRSVLIVAGAVAIGGLIGAGLGLTALFDRLAASFTGLFGRQNGLSEGLTTATILFCVGPMTLLGCIQDAMTGRSELLDLKSLLDGIASVFLAATLGAGVVLSAGSVLVIQGLLTLFARPLRPLAEREDYLAEITGIGGILILAIGINLTHLQKIPTADYLPALVLGPAMVAAGARWRARRPAA